ncbi:MAG: fused MFS/spermidine synthase [Thermoguttaceae bacterium]|nr:fused MFS/spermidine synthase [Thermoguttaceae bacterium]MDW8037899.1 fused MFS/spermidine synthase [Thermoguttaceae bacterium]
MILMAADLSQLRQSEVSCRAWQWIGVRGILWLAISALGVSAFLTQVVLLRELLAALAGNELVLGIVLGSWMLLTGWGASAGRLVDRLRYPLVILAVAQMAIGLIPLVQLGIIRTYRDLVFVRGAEVGPAETVLVCLVLLAPYCVVAGFVLTLTCRLLAPEGQPESIGQVYFLDVLGDIVGGLLFSFLLVWFLGHFGILYLSAFLNLGLAGGVGYLARSRLCTVAAALLMVALAGLATCYDLELATTQRQFAGQEVVFHGQSAYNRVVITRLAEQLTFYASGTPLFSTGDVETREQKVHFAMAQRPQARRVLLLGGGLSGTAKEVLQWADATTNLLPSEPMQVDYVELDPLLLSAGQRFVPETLEDRRIQVLTGDGRLWVRSCSTQYDVVLADVPDPLSSQWNRFYSREFFQEVKERLRAEGVFALACASYENYLSPELADLVAIVHRTLRESFQNILMIPASRIIFLASDGPLTVQIAERIAQHGLKTHSMRPGYLAGILAPDRLAALERAVRSDAPVNRDFYPILSYRHLRYWMRQHQVRWSVFLLVLTGVGLWCLWRARPVTMVVFSVGLAGSLLHVVLLLGFQVVFGCVYHRVGLMVTAFMAGLAAGSAWTNRRLVRWESRALGLLAVAVAAFAVVLPLGLVGLAEASRWPALNLPCQGTFLALSFVLAGLVGMVFPLAAKIGFEQVSITAARIYTADYLGAAFGALLGSSLLIPLLGFGPVCLLVAGLNLIAAAIIFLVRKG